ncbi:MAG TPA: glutamine synthetase, partial [Thermoplasmata archaeon]
MASVLKQIETEKIRWIDLQFVDVLGALQHITIPSTSLGPEDFKRGVGKLDGSSIKGFKEIHESDMVMNPDPNTFAVLPWYEGEHRTARFFVDVYEGGT